ncbi:bifunctional WD40 repeat/WD40-YVTN repeat-like-containing domain superfamily/WD40-repeat-containing domain superfamily [Babesia duncani]|uniref:Bifunctional WD40 repeat/WD40-YVTN repeat-like-containing domain superfamily/WD40-repeat-containing domain superfamily n=1 Tax=Babesia duncani TaxID=323732 RepID=A0AAD9UPX5_9APIC|nr:bifunctional WD40 repeat/WD40-YVTN repeat-like-containing domain superfamily/WD40-repeat-containing domain superfamily [Babesia duncani]
MPSMATTEALKVDCSSDVCNSNALPSPEFTVDESLFINKPGLLGGYIVAERPTFVNNGKRLVVVNNRKCSIYDTKSARKICDSCIHNEMIIGVDTFVYSTNVNLLFSATSSGHITISIVYDDDDDDDIMATIASIHVACKHLLSFKISKTCGSIVIVYTVDQDAIKIAKFSLNYDSIISNTTPEPLEIKVGDGQDENALVTNFRLLCFLSQLHVFAATLNLDTIGIAVGKLVLILNLESNTMIGFPCTLEVSCIAFKNSTVFAIGDFMGRITIYHLRTDSRGFQNENYAMSCELPLEPIGIKPQSLRVLIKNFLSRNEAVSKSALTHAELQCFKRIEKQLVYTSTHHWHAHAVNCLSFNLDGTILLSGGEEGVLVMWHLNTGNKKFVTRLGSPIFHTVAPVLNDGVYVVACEANVIYFIDPFALCIHNRINGISVPINIGMNIQQDNTCPSKGNVDINKAHVSSIVFPEYNVPHMHYLPFGYKNMMEALHSKSDNSMCANIALCSRSNTLQIYNVVQDLQIGSLDLKNVNLVSRQDEEFGQDWTLDEMLINDQGTVIVTIQSRSILHMQQQQGFRNENADSEDFPPDDFEHQLYLDDSKKSILKVWIQGTGTGNNWTDYLVHTRVSNPHANKVTSIQQLGSEYCFVTCSLDSEFKVWNLVKKVTIASNDPFTLHTCTRELEQVDCKIENVDVNQHVWDCVAIGTYRNLPCYSAAVLLGGEFIAIDHASMITFWTFGNSSLELCGNLSLDKLHKHIFQRPNFKSQMHLVLPRESNLILYSTNCKILLLDFARSITKWEYPVARDQFIDKVHYHVLLPQCFIVASSLVDSNGTCRGMLEIFQIHHQEEEQHVTCIFRQNRPVDGIILNACLVPSSPSPRPKGSRQARYPPNCLGLGLALLTSNFDLELIQIYTKIYTLCTPIIKPYCYPSTRVATTRKRKAPTQDSRQPLTHWLHALEQKDSGHEKKKRTKFNLAEQYYKSLEHAYRLSNPLPAKILDAVIEPTCPTRALPSPQIVFQRLVYILTTRH